METLNIPDLIQMKLSSFKKTKEKFSNLVNNVFFSIAYYINVFGFNYMFCFYIVKMNHQVVYEICYTCCLNAL